MVKPISLIVPTGLTGIIPSMITGESGALIPLGITFSGKIYYLMEAHLKRDSIKKLMFPLQLISFPRNSTGYAHPMSGLEKITCHIFKRHGDKSGVQNI